MLNIEKKIHNYILSAVLSEPLIFPLQLLLAAPSSFYFLWPTFHPSHSFNNTPSFICTAAVRPDHLQATHTHT